MRRRAAMAVVCMLWFVAALLAVGIGPAHAQTPTHTPKPTETPPPTWTITPTLHAAYATATSKYGGLRPTPTALTYQPQPAFDAFDTTDMAGATADQVINIYRFFNQWGMLDFISVIVLLALVIIIAMKSYGRLTKSVD